MSIQSEKDIAERVEQKSDDNTILERKHPLAECESCPLQSEKFVPSAGPTQADLIFVGESPGYKEAREGKPFSGPSGMLLNAVLTEYGIEREKAFLTNVCLCRPKDNATPSKAAIKCCSQRLQKEILSREPKQIVALGNTASAAIMGHSVKITSFRAGPPKQSAIYPDVEVIPTFHPAACLRASDYFPSMVTDIGKASGHTTTIKWEEPQYAEFNTGSLAARALDELLNSFDTFVIDIETAFEKDAAFERPNHYPLLCVGLCYRPGKAVIIGKNALTDQSVQKRLKNLIENTYVIAHNGKFDLSGLAGIGTGKLGFDTMLASYALDERRGTHGLKYLAAERLGTPDYDTELKQFLKGRGVGWADVPSDMLHRYNSYDVAATWALYEAYDKELTGELKTLNTFLTRASNALMQVEMAGLTIDQEALATADSEYSDQLAELEDDLAMWVDNPRSPKQVIEALSVLDLHVTSSDAETLNSILDAGVEGKRQEFITKLLEYRKSQKLYGTYIKGIRERVFGGRVFTTFMLHGTTTGRLSSRNPNLQNIPRGPTIKSMFVPAEGNALVQADYSQIEFRVVASLAQEESVAEIFRNPDRDVFGEFASQIFGADWNKHHRQITKRIIHGTDYGMGPQTMAAQMNTDAKNFGVPLQFTAQQASNFQKHYYKLVPNIIQWQRETKQRIFGEQEDLITPFGRHRRFWLITDENRYDIEHEGLAFIPQSIASDICLTALCRLVEAGIDVKLPVHDSIMAECPADQAIEVGQFMRQVMMDCGAEFSEFVPFDVDIQISAESWGAMK